jgi:hypothetical protein
MVIIAMTLYLPQHIAFLTNRAWFYYNGPEKASLSPTSSVIKSALENSSATSVVMEKVKETIVSASTAGKNLYETAAKAEL